MVGSDVLSFVGLWDLFFRVVNNSRFVSGFRVSGLYLPLWPPVTLGADLMNRCWGAMVGCRESQGSDLGLAGELFGFWHPKFLTNCGLKKASEAGGFCFGGSHDPKIPNLCFFWENENKIFQNEDSDLMCRNAKLL